MIPDKLLKELQTYVDGETESGFEKETSRNSKSLTLAVDMFGCPNRCKHCWIGHMPNRVMEENANAWLVNYFKPYFNSITYYSWLREPDYCDDYAQRWTRDKGLSVNSEPLRFELASFWRIVRDPHYVAFLKEVGVKKVQLTFFGMEEMTDKYTGRRGAFRESLEVTEILIANQIAPRRQAFINEENENEIVLYISNQYDAYFNFTHMSELGKSAT